MKKVLFVDDEKSTQLYAELSLKLIPGVEFIIAGNGKEAWDLFQQQKFNLVITDLYMPDMNGIQLNTAIRKVNKKIPVIAFTGADFDSDEDDVTEMGFTDLLQKPLDEAHFIETVKKYLGK